MTKQVALANATYERLRAHKQQGESFSQVIERLMGEKKDPLRFFRHDYGRIMSPEEHLALVEADRNTSWIDD